MIRLSERELSVLEHLVHDKNFLKYLDILSRYYDTLNQNSLSITETELLLKNRGSALMLKELLDLANNPRN